ncbi:hypothetical protein PHJA_002284800 [Phtheirospermum japonicum]|uniref:Uncharacterized protein n=1 Tax=Phtheirospermum japonicum TaxID=374723 RepID=A0A830CUW2_9LAMI|nr:hypothetical protein PHJA_002284800 [Phtheirospermum japonicum]
MALTTIDPDYTLSQAHPETMDFLSQAWCDFAVQAFQPDTTRERSPVFQENSRKIFDNDAKAPSVRTDKSARNDGDKFVPPWKSNDVKSWIWMQQAMHPEVNYNGYFKKKWMAPWKVAPLKNIKKWLKEIKKRRKEEQRLQKAEVHAAISVAGVAAALAAIAAEQNSDKSAVASAAALVAAQCAKVAEAMGAKREQLSGAIGSAISGTSATEILTLTAAAATSIRGVDALNARSGFKNMLSGSSHVLPLEDSNEIDFDFEKCRLILARGADLYVEKTDGQYLLRSVSIILNNEGKVVLKMKKLNMLNAFARQKERIVFALHAELYNDSESRETETGYLVVLTTEKGTIKVDMMNDYQRYRTWSMTIDRMLMLSTTFTKYDLQFYKQ